MNNELALPAEPIRTEFCSRSLYRVPPLDGNRNYLSFPSGFVIAEKRKKGTATSG